MEFESKNDGIQEILAYTELKNAITQRIFPPGHQLTERDVSSRLNMSRSPVRSAMKRLQAEGFLERRTNRRIYVAEPDYFKTLEVLYIREALEGMSSRLAATNHTEEDRGRLLRLKDQMNEAVKQHDTASLYHLGNMMHRTIFQASGNTQLSALATNIQAQSALFTFHTLAQESRAYISNEEHLHILNSIFERDADRAELMAREHIHVLIDYVKLAIKNNTSILK